MAKKKNKQTRRAEERDKQSPQQISWKTVAAILVSIATFVGLIVNGLDFINYLREGYQQFLKLGLIVLGLIWLIILWLLFKQRNVYGILWLAVTILAGVIVWNGWRPYVQTREEKLIVLIAQFEGPEENFGLRNEIWEKLDEDFRNDADVKIETVNEIITPDSNSGSPRAMEIGERFQADIVIWGWYRPTVNPNITIHIENLSPAQIKTLQVSETYQPQATLAELEAFEIQRQLGSETSTLISFLTGLLRYKSSDYPEAIKRFEQILANTDISTLINPFDLHFALGNSYQWTNMHDSAIQNYDKAIEINPQSAIAYSNRGSAYLFLEEHEHAIQDFEMAIKIDPQLDAAFNNRGLIYFSLGEYERAIQDFDMLIEIAPSSAIGYSNRGVIYLSLGEYERAIQDFDKTIELFEFHDATAFYLRGSSYAHLGEQERAIQDYDKAIELDAQFVFAYDGRGVAYSYLGEYDKAIQNYTRAIEINPQYASAYNNRGMSYSELGLNESAIQDFDKAIQLNPNYDLAFYNRGGFYYQLGRYERAIQDFDKAIQLNPNMANAYNNRGLSYRKLDQNERAIQDYDKAIQLNPNMASAYRNRGLAYQALGKTAEAEADFKKYEELTGQKPPINILP